MTRCGGRVMSERASPIGQQDLLAAIGDTLPRPPLSRCPQPGLAHPRHPRPRQFRGHSQSQRLTHPHRTRTPPQPRTAARKPHTTSQPQRRCPAPAAPHTPRARSAHAPAHTNHHQAQPGRPRRAHTRATTQQPRARSNEHSNEEIHSPAHAPPRARPYTTTASPEGEITRPRLAPRPHCVIGSDIACRFGT